MTSIEKNDPFKKGDVVWAKVKGHPWWPGQIRRINNKHSKTEPEDKQTIYRINFIGENTHVDLPRPKVENFTAKYEKYSHIKKKTLQKAIDKAKRMLREKESIIHNRDISLQDQSEDESETESIVLDDDEEEDDENKNKQCIGSKRVPKSKNSKISYMNQLKENKNTNKRNNTNINANLSSKSHINSNHVDSSSLCGLNRNPNNINISININVTNNNHNNVNISSFENNRPSTEPISNINNPNRISKSQNIPSQHEESESFTEEDFEELMKSLVENLLKYQIEVSNSSIQKSIINTLDKIKDLLSNETFLNLYELTKDIIPITHTFTYHKNHDIKMRSTELLSLITSAMISQVFNLPSTNIIPSSDFIYKYNENDINDNFKQNLVSVVNDTKKRNNIYAIPTNEIINALIYSKNEEINNTIDSVQTKRNKMLLGRKKKRSNIPNTNKSENDFHVLCSKKEGVNTFNHNIDVDDKDFKFIYEDFLKVLNNNNAVNTFDTISSDFYKNTYNKFNGLDIVSSKKRKQVCLKLLSLLKKILIGVDIESLKKIIIFFEYQARNEDPTFGKKYIQHIGSFYIKMKEIINEKDKDINDS